MTQPYEETLRREIVTTRIFDAPRDVVFDAWTDPDQLKHWWGPHKFTNTFHQFDFKPEGMWRYTMHGPNGQNYENEMKFIEITPPERLVIDHLSEPQFRLTVLFEELGKRTKITFRQLFSTEAVYGAVRLRAIPGNEENLERLAAWLARAA